MAAIVAETTCGLCRRSSTTPNPMKKGKHSASERLPMKSALLCRPCANILHVGWKDAKQRKAYMKTVKQNEEQFQEHLARVVAYERSFNETSGFLYFPITFCSMPHGVV